MDVSPQTEVQALPEFLCDNELLEEITAIPQKLAFKIGDVADIVGVKQYVLRYWESEFDSLRPKKSKAGQRVYTKNDVETALMIRKLLHRDRFSIEGAKGVLRQVKSQVRREKDQFASVNKKQKILSDIANIRAQIFEVRQLFDGLGK